MAFRTDAPILPLESLQWEDSLGDGKVLLAHFRLGPLDMHLQAEELVEDDDGLQSMHYSDNYEALCTLTGGEAMEPLEINGRSYIVYAHPYAA